MNYTKDKYIHLTIQERFFIQKSIENNTSLRAIARELKRNVGTISREIKRNSCFDEGYEHSKADIKSKRRSYHKYISNWIFWKFWKTFKIEFCSFKFSILEL